MLQAPEQVTSKVRLAHQLIRRVLNENSSADADIKLHRTFVFMFLSCSPFFNLIHFRQYEALG